MNKGTVTKSSTTKNQGNKCGKQTPSRARNSNSDSSGQPKSSTSSSSSALASSSARDLCGYTHRVCLQNRLEGYEYCIRHILGEKNAPFKQCSYIHPISNKRCPNAARKTERKHSDSSFCPWHIKKLCLKRKQNEKQGHSSKSKEVQGQKSISHLLKDLEHYCEQDHVKARKNLDWIKIKQDDENISVATDELRSKVMEAAAALQESDSDDNELNNPAIVDTLRPDVLDSDSEEMNDLSDDLEGNLKHAGIFTAEEVSLILSEKMHKLQSLYVEQFRHLRHLLKEKHRKYFLNSIQEQEPHITHLLELSSAADRDKFRAMRRYHKYRGKEALLKKQAKEKRKQLTNGQAYVEPQHSKCIFLIGNETQCTNRTLPASHYCFKHILYDVHQMLFRPCASGIPPCLNPVISFQHRNSCLNHRELKTNSEDVTKVLNLEDKSMAASNAEPELFQTMDDIAALALDAVAPTSLFGLDQFGDLGSSSDQNMIL